MKCKQCNQDNDLMTGFTKHQVCGKCTRKNHSKAVGELSKANPNVPDEVFEIEASQEVAEMYSDMFGY